MIRTVWTIAGSDPSGGAGIEIDLKTLQHFNVHGCAIITALTVQNSQKVFASQAASAGQIKQQLAVLAEDMPADVIKIGMLADQSIAQTVADFLENFSGLVVYDPVLASSSGLSLISHSAINDLIEKIIPEVDVFTPNIPEAEIILERKIVSEKDIIAAAQAFIALGAKNVVIKGGHADSDFCTDYWSNGDEHAWLTSPRQMKNVHGTGCCFASSIAAALANGENIKEALVIAKMTINAAIRTAYKPGKGADYLNLFASDPLQSDMPMMNAKIAVPTAKHFPLCEKKIGLYPIVENSHWLERCLKQGVHTIQLRIKNQSSEFIENEIKRSVAIAQRYQAQLFINDHWQLAIKYQAYGVHLGQEDLPQADIAAIYQAGLRLGISTHCHYEVAQALAHQPSYIAIGPVFTTHTKIMLFSPQGIAKLHYWRKLLTMPLVAIGGINLENLSQVLQTNVDGIAVISAITQADDPEQAIVEFRNLIV